MFELVFKHIETNLNLTTKKLKDIALTPLLVKDNNLKTFRSSDKIHDNCIHVKLSINNCLLPLLHPQSPQESQTSHFFLSTDLILGTNTPVLWKIDNVTRLSQSGINNTRVIFHSSTKISVPWSMPKLSKLSQLNKWSSYLYSCLLLLFGVWKYPSNSDQNIFSNVL